MLGAEIDGEVSEAGGLFWHHTSDHSRHINGDPREAVSHRLMACLKAVRLNYYLRATASTPEGAPRTSAGHLPGRNEALLSVCAAKRTIRRRSCALWTRRAAFSAETQIASRCPFSGHQLS